MLLLQEKHNLTLLKQKHWQSFYLPVLMVMKAIHIKQLFLFPVIIH